MKLLFEMMTVFSVVIKSILFFLGCSFGLLEAEQNAPVLDWFLKRKQFLWNTFKAVFVLVTVVGYLIQ